LDIILVNENDVQVGTMEKMEVHERGLLHRAFSVFIFNKQGEMLLQQRALSKYHSGGLWTNACCSHPRPGEATADAAARRLKEELGFTTELRHAFSFTYQASFDNGLTEHEFDHVFVGEYDGALDPDAREVDAAKYLTIAAIDEALKEEPESFTAWFRIAWPLLKDWSESGVNL
jgi:isopentenyl-diphosphate Delta-isomerase